MVVTSAYIIACVCPDALVGQRVRIVGPVYRDHHYRKDRGSSSKHEGHTVVIKKVWKSCSSEAIIAMSGTCSCHRALSVIYPENVEIVTHKRRER